MEEKNYGYNLWPILPFWLLIIFLIDPLYRMIKDADSIDDYWHFAIMIGLIGVVLFQLTRVSVFIIRGIPALRLTKDGLVITQKGLSIDWDDITGVRIGGTKASYLAIAVKDPEKYYSHAILRKLYLWLASISEDEFSTGLTLVYGDNQEILNAIESRMKYYKQSAVEN